MKRVLLSVPIIFFQFIFYSSLGQQKCADILRIAFNTSESNESTDMTNSVFNYLQSNQFKKYIKEQGGGFNLGFEGFSLGANTSDKEFSEWKSHLNSTNSSDFKNKIVKSTLQQIPNKEAYKVWLSCINKMTQGFYFDNYQEGDSYMLIVGYNPTPGITDMTVEYLRIDNADYDTSFLQKGSKIYGYPVEIILEPKNKHQDIKVSLKAVGNIANSQIQKSYIIPGVKPVPIDSFSVFKSKCVDLKDKESCSKCILELQKRFSYQVDNSKNPDLQIAFDKFKRYFQNCIIGIDNGMQPDKYFGENLEVEFKNILKSIGVIL